MSMIRRRCDAIGSHSTMQWLARGVFKLGGLGGVAGCRGATRGGSDATTVGTARAAQKVA
eukprot:COSAG02_NODE_2503_length_8671_cov_20.133108_5_plen_60_part_00